MQFLRVFFTVLSIMILFLLFLFWIQLKYSNTLFIFVRPKQVPLKIINNLLFWKAGDLIYLFVAGAKNYSTTLISDVHLLNIC